MRLDGASVETCPSGDAGLKEIRRHAYDAIISDWRMPGLDGFSFCRETTRLQPDVPFILVIAHADVGRLKLGDEPVSSRSCSNRWTAGRWSTASRRRCVEGPARPGSQIALRHFNPVPRHAPSSVDGLRCSRRGAETGRGKKQRG